eukprot:m.353518 g.353518  ORF g.353518 m.353518 type:complete len:527 (-) comp16782_c0_seq1:131-1711(-)
MADTEAPQLTAAEKAERRAAKKAAKEAEKAAKKAAKEARQKERQAAEEAKALAAANDPTFGVLPLIQSQSREGKVYSRVGDMDTGVAGQEVLLRARIHTLRVQARAIFIRLRQRTKSVQCVVDGAKVSKALFAFVSKINPESVVDIKGTIVESPVVVSSCSQQTVELHVSEVHVVAAAIPQLPLQVEDAGRSEHDPMLPERETLLDHRILDLRAEPNQAIFKLQGAVGLLFREFMIANGFTEIHSPKILSVASESGASVFKLGYFKSEAFLAQSPQLYKQMAIASDFERVFEIGPVFRAENSNTHRHLTEFVGLDFEMAFHEHYHEVMDVMDKLFVSLFRGLTERFSDEIAAVNKQYKRDPFVWLEPSLRIEWPEGIAMLREAGVDIGDFDDLSTPQEALLGKLVKAKYGTDFYILDKFPLCIRPFYTMPDPKNPNYSNSYDLMMRGEEIMSGAQRVHDPVLLEKRAAEHGIKVEEIQSYIDAFKYGCPPHAGGGVGLERVVMLFLGLPNIRKTSLFPRDPKRVAP